MSEASNSHFTRGAQLWAHNIRMALQGCKNICIFGLAFIFFWFSYRVSQYMSWKALYYFAIERYASFKLALASIFVTNGTVKISFYTFGNNAFITRGAANFIDRFWNSTEYGLIIQHFLDWFARNALLEGVLSFIIGSVTGFVFFVLKGRSVIRSKKLRGGELVSVLKLRRILKLSRNASKIEISGLPLVKDTETQHLLLTGTTGSGKTNMLNELLPQIRMQNQRVIIFDVTGSFVDRFYNPSTDILLNPLEANSAGWLPWNDCQTDEDFNNLAAAFVDGESIVTDKYWEQAAQKVLSEAFKKESYTRNIGALLDIIGKAPLSEFCQYFADTHAAAFVSKEAEKGTASVRSTLLNKIERLKYLKNGGDFSIRDWVNNGSGWLFITAKPSQLNTLRPLVSAWFNIAIQGMLERPHSAFNAKMWFVLDELPALQKIPSLEIGLAQGRKYGACFVAGIQNISQLEKIYGRAGSISLLDMFNTRFYFAVSDNEVAEYASKSLGQTEQNEIKESLSYGSNTMRDGVNINSNTVTKYLIMPNQIKDLKPRTCYVKLPQGYPITLLKIKLQTQSRFLKLLYSIFNSKKRIKSDIQTKTVHAQIITSCKENIVPRSFYTKEDLISVLNLNGDEK
jgi:type IV conjugative transfer system coupling protein TraD